MQKVWGLGDEAADTFQGRSHDFFAIGIDDVSAFDAMETGYPGFAGMTLARDPRAAAEMDEPYIYHFPDGNASIARAIVRSLIPAVAPGDSMEDLVTARFDYGTLDVDGAATRLRLRATGVHVRNHEGGVDVGYVRDGQLHRVRAARAILAGYHMMIPSIMPELPATQRRALRANVKAPLSYTKVAVRDWHPWVRLGVHEITNPMGFFSRLKLDYPVSIGDYRCPRTPDEPMVLHLVHVPTVPNRGLSTADARRAARQLLYDTSFEDFEFHVRDELTRMLAAGGFDADRDIAAITVNRWGHGYSYSGEGLAPEEDRPYEVARARRGRVAFANADAVWTPMASAAIAQGHRAVQGSRRRGLTFPLGEALPSVAMDERLTIGRFARLTGLTPKALRHYDAIGLLRPAAVADNGYRVYAREQVEAGRTIRRLRDLDVPLEDIRAVLDDPDQAGKRLEAYAREVEADLFRRQRTLHQLRNLTDEKERTMTSIPETVPGGAHARGRASPGRRPVQPHVGAVGDGGSHAGAGRSHDPRGACVALPLGAGGRRARTSSRGSGSARASMRCSDARSLRPGTRGGRWRCARSRASPASSVPRPTRRLARASLVAGDRVGAAEAEAAAWSAAEAIDDPEDRQIFEQDMASLPR